ncbi:Momilactone A synthase [Dichanthelium oligosanthes]|uniref:Momilactone A synthase n=1 Tax=Dichanthelium oligosanthes TaxID=888268 RepID=A0A1E5UK52_9POAL|nr:Momilactone A synthase [Dichanthelium oligosanthes]
MTHPRPPTRAGSLLCPRLLDGRHHRRLHRIHRLISTHAGPLRRIHGLLTRIGTIRRNLLRQHRLEGKVITGGASGTGERTVGLFVKHGTLVVVADVQDEAGARLCAEIGAGAASYARCDVTVEDDVAAAVDHAVATFGALYVMFNNAGVSRPAACYGVRESGREDFDRVLAVNLVGPFLGVKHAARVMVPGRAPRRMHRRHGERGVGGVRRGPVRLHVRQACGGGADGERGGGLGRGGSPRRLPRRTWAWTGRR